DSELGRSRNSDGLLEIRTRYESGRVVFLGRGPWRRLMKRRVREWNEWGAQTLQHDAVSETHVLALSQQRRSRLLTIDPDAAGASQIRDAQSGRLQLQPRVLARNVL